MSVSFGILVMFGPLNAILVCPLTQASLAESLFHRTLRHGGRNGAKNSSEIVFVNSPLGQSISALLLD